MRRSTTTSPCVALGVLLALSASVHAGAWPDQLSVQGRVLQDSQPMTGTVTMTFRLHEDSVESSAIKTEMLWVYPDDRGYFVTALGESVYLAPSLFDRPLYLGVTVDEPHGGTEMTPRQALMAAPYAMRARLAAARGEPRILHVPLGANESENGAALRAAVARAGETTAEAEVILLGPGTYHLGDSSLNLTDDVTLIGAGPDRTILKVGTGVNTAVYAASGSILRHLSIEHPGALSGTSIGILASGGSLDLEDVRIVTASGTSSFYGIQALGDATLRLDGVHLELEGTTGTGLYMATTGEVLVERSRIEVRTTGDGSGSAGVSAVTVRSSLLSATSSTGSANGMILPGSGTSQVQGCQLVASAPGTAKALRVDAGTARVDGCELRTSGAGTQRAVSGEGGVVEVTASRLRFASGQLGAYNSGGTVRLGATVFDNNAGATPTSGTVVCAACIQPGAVSQPLVGVCP